VLAGFGLYAVVFAGPVSSLAFATNEHETYQTYRWARQYVLSHADQTVLMVSPSTIMFTLYGRPSVSVAQANFAPEKLMGAKELGLYHEVWVLQEMMISQRLNSWIEYPNSRLDRRLILEPVAEWEIRPELRVRISRVVGFDPKRPAGTVRLPKRGGTATLSTTQVAWDSQDTAATEPQSAALTARPADEPAAVPTAKDLPADVAGVEDMLMHQLPGL